MPVYSSGNSAHDSAKNCTNNDVPKLAINFIAIHRIISAIRPHIAAEDALTGGHIYVGGDEAADFGVVVAGGEIVEAGFGIVVVTAITERVVCAKCSCQGAGGGYQLAPRIVDIFYHTHAAFVHKANYIILAVSQIIVLCAVVVHGYCLPVGIVAEQQRFLRRYCRTADILPFAVVRVKAYLVILCRGNKFNYTYDSKHNLLSAVSESGMKYTFTYDSKGNALTSRTGSDSEYIQTSATYTSVGSFVSSVTDARGKSVSYGYDTDKGLRTSVTDANGNVAAYSYDSMNRLSGLTQGNAQVGYTYDDDELIGISHNGFSYGMTYDLFGHTLATKVNSDVLSQNTYDNSRGLLTSAQYGNGLNIHYEYDVLDRITEVRFGSTKMYSYSYDGDGNLQRMVDNLRDITTSYYYDLSGRLIRSASSDGSEYLYEYDLNDNLTKLHQSAGGSSWVTEYTYDKDNRPVTVKVNGKTITDSYNAAGTRSSRVYGFATPYTVSFGYLAGANGSKTTMLQSYKNGSDAAYTYTYDNNGNVTSISQGTKSAAYAYDALNQLTRVNDGFTNKTTTYTYDNAGNILERKEYAYTTGTLGTPTATFAYEYDSEWKDKLVSYNGETISYDEIGNPVSYRGYTMAWQGKRLESLSGDGLTASYTYDEQGIRSGKTINGVTTSFSYNGSLLMAQVTPEKSLLFSYDANGQAISVNYNGTEYYYLRNGQNDIVGLMDESGVRVVEYIYDAWGKLISTTGTLATTLGADNPFRYRGYYYDTETGLYYLTTRYYDPEVCRFISADVYMSTGQGVLGGNMWAYCLNNSVNMIDVNGELASWSQIFTGIAIAAAIVAVVAVTVMTVGAAAPALALVSGTAISSAMLTTTATAAVATAGIASAAAVISASVEKTRHSYREASNGECVYVMRDKSTNEVQYVGRTNNPARRQMEHSKDPKKANLNPLEVKYVGLAKYDARIVEQLLISAYTLDNLSNARREIAKGKVHNAAGRIKNIARIIGGARESELLSLMER